MTYIVYILYSKKLDKYYIGYTGDVLDERVRRHNSNHKGFTGGKGDWVIKHKELFNSKAQATSREKEIKSKKSRKYIERLIAQLD